MLLLALVSSLICLLSFLCSCLSPVPLYCSPLYCFSNTWLNVRCFPSTFYVRGIWTKLWKVQISTKMENSCMCSSFFKGNRVVFHVHCSFQSLTLPVAASCSAPGCYCSPGTTVCCWHCGGSSITATAPHPTTCRFQILCGAQVCGFT